MDDLVKREFLIFKSGRGWYRENSQGYAFFKFDAGRFTEQEAISITHPNGLTGPRDGMYYRHESDVRDYPSDRIEALEAQLAKLVSDAQTQLDAVEAYFHKQTDANAEASLIADAKLRRTIAEITCMAGFQLG